jgi:hypothetical protein
MPHMQATDLAGLPGRRRGALILSAVAAGTALVATVGSGGLLATGGADYSWLMTFYGISAYTAVGIVILWQRPGHGIGRLTLSLGLALAVAVLLNGLATLLGPIPLAPPGAVDWQRAVRGVLATLVEAIPALAIWLGGVLLIAWFPDGRPTSRAGRVATRLVVVTGSLLVVGALADTIAQTTGLDAGGAVGDGGTLAAVSSNVATASLVSAFALAVVDLAARYHRTDPLRRAQIRWVMAATGFSAITTLLVLLSGSGIIPFEIPGLWDAWILSLMLPVLAIGIAVTRYHLYDIDRIVSRSIAYVAISVVLFAVFALVNLAVTQVLTRFLPDDARTVGVALSTLAVAALFQPMRTRTQVAVDRRFHRARYDAQLTVDGFATRLRGQIDLRGVGRELEAATVDAVEPSTAAVWLRRGHAS